jgi:hypothetical protein
MTKINIILLTAIFFSQLVFSQTRLSVSTDLSLQKSVRRDQKFWAVGQNAILSFHFTSRDAAYASVSYYSIGKFQNRLTATAKSPATIPSEIGFTNNAEVQIKEISMGWKHYIYGNAFAEGGWAVYGFTGFGLIFGKATNNYNTTIDTSLYNTPVRPVSGKGHFKRLTFDVGLGWETHLGADYYLYAEGKIWIPATEYPSKYLLTNNNAPLTGMLGVGIRILF